jgi:YbgC/YbaW family acyl-CoA thioester hydrolase
MDHDYEETRRVEFADTDMAGIVHFANFFRWMESAEHAYFRSLGLSVHAAASHGFARVHADCDFRSPLRYAERFRVRLTVASVGRTSIGYDFEFHGPLADEPDAGADPPLVATGALRVVCVTRRPGQERLVACPLPDDVENALRKR